MFVAAAYGAGALKATRPARAYTLGTAKPVRLEFPPLHGSVNKLTANQLEGWRVVGSLVSLHLHGLSSAGATS